MVWLGGTSIVNMNETLQNAECWGRSKTRGLRCGFRVHTSTEILTNADA